MHLTALFRHKYNYLKLINKYISIFFENNSLFTAFQSICDRHEPVI